MPLPALLWRPSPNFSHRSGARVDLLVLHDCEGGYSGSIEWFANRGSAVSAHYVLREDGLEATQMVELADKAWHACNFNSRSVGVEMSGYAKNGFSDALLASTAGIFAYLGHHLQIPLRHARGGVGPGIASHFDLGPAGGGHRDPATDPSFMDRFVAKVQAAANRGDFPALWTPAELDTGRPCSLKQAQPGSARQTTTPDVRTISGLQSALKSIGFRVAVDGDYGPETRQAVTSFQMHAGIAADGICGPQTEAALLKALSHT